MYMHAQTYTHAYTRTHTLTHSYTYTHTHRQWGGNLKYIEQRELYQSASTHTKNPSLPDNVTAPPLVNTKCHPTYEDKPVIDSLKSTRMPELVLELVLHACSVAMDEFVKQMCTESVISKKSTVQCSRDAACNKTQSPQCFFVSSSDSELSPGSTTTAESFSPAAACCESTMNHSPIAPSTTQLSVPGSVGDNGTKT